MLLIANNPLPVGLKNPKDVTMCGDPQVYPGDPRYSIIPSLDGSKYLAVDTNGKLSWTSSASSFNVVQTTPAWKPGDKFAGFIEVERAGSMIFPGLFGQA